MWFILALVISRHHHSLVLWVVTWWYLGPVWKRRTIGSRLRGSTRRGDIVMLATDR